MSGNRCDHAATTPVEDLERADYDGVVCCPACRKRCDACGKTFYKDSITTSTVVKPHGGGYEWNECPDCKILQAALDKADREDEEIQERLDEQREQFQIDESEEG